MPGVLTIEAMAQAGAIMGLIHSKPEDVKDAVVYFMGIDEAGFGGLLFPVISCELSSMF
jgi:3-hydroxymyristoyl/3-hydroxydecanoyl-(acyl carrier protein) dehydratase